MVYKNFVVLLCFFIMIILLSELWNLIRNLARPVSELATTSSLSSRDLQALLQYRGVPYNEALVREQSELRRLLNGSGLSVTGRELELARHFSAQLSTTEQQNFCTKTETTASLLFSAASSTATASLQARVIPSEELFYELVEDSKDSAWILMTIFPKSRPESTEPERERLRQIWCQIRRMYWQFGVNTAILDCGQLYNLCWDRGFHRSPFVLVLPRGRERVKDSVDFFVYPYSTSAHKTSDEEEASASLQRSVSNWLRQRLAHRVDLSLSKVFGAESPTENPAGSEHRRNSGSGEANFISVYTARANSNFRDGVSQLPPSKLAPSLAIAAHSVKFTGRIHFSLGLDTELPSSLQKRLAQQHQQPPQSPSHYFVSQDEDIVYLYGRSSGQTLSFESLQLFFRHLCPSTNDIFIWNLVLVNLMISFQAAFQNGSLALRLGYYVWYFLIFNLLYCCIFLFVLSALSFSPLLARFNHYLLMLWRRFALTRIVNHLRYLQLNQDIDLVLFLTTWALFVLIIGKFHKDGDPAEDANIEDPVSTAFGVVGLTGEDEDIPWDPEAGPQIDLLSSLGSLNLSLQQQPPLYISCLLKWSFQVPRSLANRVASRYKRRHRTDSVAKTPSSLREEARTVSSIPATEDSDGGVTGGSSGGGGTGLSSGLAVCHNCGSVTVANGSGGSSGSSNNTSPVTRLVRSADVVDSQGAVDPVRQQCHSGSPIKWPTGYIFTDQCCICLGRFKRDDLLCGLPCGHAFHDRCIKEWLIEWGKDDCPQCRWPAYKVKL